MSTNDLWAGMRIPIVMVSGLVNSGKTLFGLTIDPNCRRPASECQPTTLVYDQEGSAEPYVGGLNFEWKDTRAAVGLGVHNEVVQPAPSDPRWLQILKSKADCNDSPAASMFRAWYLSLLKVEPGRYSVGICDTFTPLQEGMIDWLRRHPEAFARTVNEYTKASSMFFWPDLKAMLSHILTVDCRLRFQTFVLNVHLKNEWAGGTKTGQKVAEGLDVLEKLATLHLELDRTPKTKGKDAPRVPAAIVKKERLVRFGATGNDDKPVLPPRIGKCTPDEIRRYIANPPDFSKLDPEERLPDQSMSDDEKLRLQAAIAENQRAAEESHAASLEIARQAAQQRYVVGAQPEAVAVAAPASTPPQPATAQPPATPAMITQQQATEMMGLMRETFASGAEAVQWLSTHYQASDPARLTETQAMGVISDLLKQKAERQLAAAPKPTPAQPNGNGALVDGPATLEQRQKIRELTEAIYGETAADEQKKFLAQYGVQAVASLTLKLAAMRIAELSQMMASHGAAVAQGADIPF